MKYELTGKNHNSMIIVQHLDSGNYDYSEYGFIDAAAEAALSEWWTEDHELDRETALEQCIVSMEWYWPQDLVSIVESGYSWPIDLGFVEVVE